MTITMQVVRSFGWRYRTFYIRDSPVCRGPLGLMTLTVFQTNLLSLSHFHLLCVIFKSMFFFVYSIKLLLLVIFMTFAIPATVYNIKYNFIFIFFPTYLPNFSKKKSVNQ